MHTLAVIVTAYCLAGTTFTGTHTHPGSVAVDPNIIPFGTIMHIPGYGRGRAEDTGSAVRGHHIDVWFRSCARARTWGVRHLKIQVTGLEPATSRPHCGVSYPPRAMDWHHVRGVKEFDVAVGIRRYSRARILAEIAKCDLLCAVCHRLVPDG